MIKDKVIELKNGINYYVFEELEYNNKKYILAAECDLEKDELNEEKILVMEIKINDTDLITTDITDDDIAKKVTELLLEKVRNNN